MSILKNIINAVRGRRGDTFITHYSTTDTENPAPKNKDGYDTWLQVLSKSWPNKHEFQVYGTRAAILWDGEYSLVQIVCISAFNKGEPSTNTFDYYEFDVDKWYWTGSAPRGCASKIKGKLAELRDSGAFSS